MNVNSNQMKQILFIVSVIIVGCQPTEKPIAEKFKTAVYNLGVPNDSVEYAKWKQHNLKNKGQIKIETLLAQDSIPIGELYFSDEHYFVYGYCMGEFGGCLMFQDRKAKDSIYYLECTCPVMIDKRKKGYYITESLAHGEGFGKVKFFESPKELVKVHLDSLRTSWKTKMYTELTEYEIWKRLENQGKIVIDTMGLTFNLFFPNQNKDYLIFSDHANTYLGLVTPDSLITVDTLLYLPTWRYNTQLNDKNNGYYHYNFQRHSGYSDDKIIRKTVSSGDIYAKGDSIVIAYKHNETTEKK